MIKIDTQLISPVFEKAEVSARKRSNHNFHNISEDALQRMLNAMNPDTYVQPHMHKSPDKREAFILLEGKVVVIEFSENGFPVDFIILDLSLKNYGCEIPPGTWHTIICLRKNSLLYEVKDGPYNVMTDKIFAHWAPAEGDPIATDYNKKLLKQMNISH